MYQKAIERNDIEVSTLDIPGVTIQVLHEDETSGGTTVLTHIAAGATIPEHWHTAADETVFVLSADTNRVFELMIYHTVPGKVPALESLFRDSYKLQAKHGLNVIGYWVPNEDPTWKNTFVYLIAHPSRPEADENWHALHSDPAFLPYRHAAEPLIEHPTTITRWTKYICAQPTFLR
jgi:hypothetical protein